jgi:two-component system CheB/CheR fusion protein
VPACSTGEEAYSVAIALAEYMDDNNISRPVQLFATDLDDSAIGKARKGIYPENISRDVSPERLRRFFEKSGSGYVINKTVRETCIFAKQDMVKDPPFSRIDLISCRNVLSSFDRELRKKAVRILFYALNPGGFLLIGPSETFGDLDGLFSVEDREHAVYARKAEGLTPSFEEHPAAYGKETVPVPKAEDQPAGVFDIRRAADGIILSKYRPSGFIDNEAETVRLRQELAASKEQVKTVTREFEAANEELQALNEELQSSNEELQSINEEMETATEELQSANEELTTVNNELQSRTDEAIQLNNDLVNVLRGVDIPIVLLGSGLQIRRFNDAAARLLNLIPSDAGRPLSDIRTHIHIPDLEQMVQEVINSLAVREKEVLDREDRWYSVTIRPYRTVDNRIDGVLMTLVDINNIKSNLLRVEAAYDYAHAIVEAVRESLLVLGPDLRVMTANKSFYENFLTIPEATEGRYIYELGNGQWNLPALMTQLRQVLPEKKSFSDFEVAIEFPNVGRRVMMLHAREVYLEEPYFKTGLDITGDFDRLILLVVEDITERKKSDDALKTLNRKLLSVVAELKAAYEEMESFSYSVSHDLRAPLRIIDGFSDILLEDHSDKLDDEGRKLLHAIRGQSKRMDQLIMAMLELSTLGRQEMTLDEIDMKEAAEQIAADLKAIVPERTITIAINDMPPAQGDLTLLDQVLTNLLSNAVKFTKHRDGASIEVGGRVGDRENVYYVKDNGIGFDAAYADKLFEAFQRLHRQNEFEGVGIGLSIVERIIKRHGGRVWAEGRPDEGATFYFTLPRTAA